MSHTWVASNVGLPLPPNSVLGGVDSDGTLIYIGRAMHEGDPLPAKIIPEKDAAYVSYNGKAFFKRDYEVLTGGLDMKWVLSCNGQAPPGTISSGRTRTGDELLIGRTMHRGSITPGKIHKSHGCLYFPYCDVEQNSKQYQALVGKLIVQPKAIWIQSNAREAIPAGAILAGNDSDGDPIYIGRAYHENDHLIAKVIPRKKTAYVPFNGMEFAKEHYEILCHGNVKWVPAKGKAIPPGAIGGGRTGTGEILYVGRGRHNNSLTVGKINPSHKSLYIPYDGVEIKLKAFEFLVEY